jgi:hypothetical protein
MALGATLGTLAMVLVVVPILFAVIVGSSQGTAELTLLFHPFMALSMMLAYGERSVYSSSYEPTEYVPHSLWGYPQVIIYVVLTIVLVVWAAKTLVFAENDVRFISRSPSDA